MNKWKYLKEEYTRCNNSKSGSGISKECHQINQPRFLEDIVSFKP